MSRLFAPGPLAGMLFAAASIATAFGKPALASFFGNPALPGEIMTGLAVVTPIVAGLLHNGSKPLPPLT